MNKLETARAQISEIDQQMAELFEQRMQAVELVAEHKREHGLPILDTAREQALIERNSNYIRNGVIREYYVQFLKNTRSSSSNRIGVPSGFSYFSSGPNAMPSFSVSSAPIAIRIFSSLRKRSRREGQ